MYRPHSDQQPTVLISDDRVHDRLLCRMVCSAYGLSDSEWQLRRLVESLPSLPTEQHVLSPLSLAWNLVQVPVDLRPLGGRISLLTTGRCTSCGDIAAAAINAQRLGPCPVFLCRTSQGWFHPTARLLLLPHGDAFQVWPMNQASVTSLDIDNPEGRDPTLEDCFSTSLSLPSVGELAYHDLSGANAVVLHLHGHTYTCLPSYADHLTLRSAALHAVAADLRVLAHGRLCFARMLPPLDRLPAIQFVAAYCNDEEVMGVVDLRPSGGGVYVVQVPTDATPAERIACAVSSHGEPDPEYPLAASLAQGLLHVMHREHVVDPFAPLAAAVPAPVVVTRRHSHVAAGYRDPLLPPEDLGIGLAPGNEGSVSDSSGTRQADVGRLLLWGILLSVCPSSLRSCGLLFVGLLVGHAQAVQLPEASGLVSGSLGPTWQVVHQHPSLASVAEHATLSRSLDYLDSRRVLGVSLDRNDGLPTFQFCVWSPGDKICFLLDGDASPIMYRERLLEVKAVLGRGSCLPWDPQPLDRCLHLVAMSKDPAFATVIVDTGREYFCIDVPRGRPGPSILSAMQLLCPGQLFRVVDSVRTPVRDGDVLRVQSDAPATPATPQFQIPLQAYSPIAEDSQQSVDMGLMRLTVPHGVTAWTLERALLTWLGRQRCMGVRLHQVGIAGSAPLYCLPRRGRSTLVVALVDLVDHVLDPVVSVVDADGPQELDCEVLREPWRPASLYWNEVLERGPVCVACWTAATSAPRGGPPFRYITLGLDICRALGTGWNAPITSQIPQYDLVQGAARQGIVWATASQPLHTHEVSTQTVASYWPMRASPLFSAAMPVPRRAAGCSFNSRYGSEGTLFHLECPQMHVRCTLPCVAGRHIWALRIGNWVHAACTPHMGWHEVLEVAGLSFWDLPGTSIHGAEHVWSWPDDLDTLSGCCGHVMHEGSDPYLGCLRFSDSYVPGPVPEPPSSQSAAVRQPYALGWALLFALPNWYLRGLAMASFISAGYSSGESDSSSAEHFELNSTGWQEEHMDDMHPAQGDSTRTCTVAWCHELSCQNTHFAVAPAALAEYFNTHAPMEIVRVHLWLPFQGPALFDFPRGSAATVLEAKLTAAGHGSQHTLFVAFDTQATVVDLISIPPGGSTWWIVRDGFSRELLRPVTTWSDDNRRAIVTLNSHGQVASLVATPEIAGMYHLPHGARGTTATPLTRVYGHLTAAGLVFAEACIGVSAAAQGQPGFLVPLFLISLRFLPLSAAMMQDQVVISGSQSTWGSSSNAPRSTRIWTHTLAAPVVVPYADPPDPAAMAAAVAATSRGVHSGGLFAWTNPRHWGDSAHVLHYPAGVCPPCVFWLMHYRGRGAVVCAMPGSLDWQYLAQEAAESFSIPGFIQGTSGIQHHGRVFSFGSELVAPPHGTILHLVRTGSRAAAGAAVTVWDAPADLPWVPQFDYHICRGPRGAN